MILLIHELKKLFRLRLSVAFCPAFTGLLIVLTVLNYASFIYPITHQTASEPETDKGDISHTSDYTPYV